MKSSPNALIGRSKIAAVLLLLAVLVAPVTAQPDLRQSVPYVVNAVGTGSAYWVAPQTLRTVAHVARHQPLYVNGVEAKVLCIDEPTDSALIRAGEGPIIPEGRITLQLGDEVLLVGWPNRKYVEVTATVHGYVLSLPYQDGRYVGPLYILKTDRNQWAGSSGGVVLRNGVAVATITGGMGNMVSVVPIPDAKCQLTSQGEK